MLKTEDFELFMAKDLQKCFGRSQDIKPTLIHGIGQEVLYLPTCDACK